MKINWKVRFKNPVFLVQLGLSVILPVFGYFGLTAQDITTWSKALDLLVDAVSNPYVVSLIAVSAWNAINDATVAGLGDSKQSLTYDKPKKD